MRIGKSGWQEREFRKKISQNDKFGPMPDCL